MNCIYAFDLAFNVRPFELTCPESGPNCRGQVEKEADDRDEVKRQSSSAETDQSEDNIMRVCGKDLRSVCTFPRLYKLLPCAFVESFELEVTRVERWTRLDS